MNRALTLLMIACLSLSSIAFGVAADETEDIPANAAATGAHDALVAALTHAGLVETLQGDGPFTVFAPTDAAFEAAGIDLSTFDNDEANATLADILLYHVLDGAVDAANVSDGLVATMANGDNATFTVDNGTVMINDATVTTADVAASNGIIHVIDKVLLPPVEEPALEDITGVAAGTGVHGALVAALAHAELVATLQGEGPFTVFAPTDAAFEAAGINLTTFDNDEANATLADILLYHVVAGSVSAADVTDGMTATM
ncbi:MAG: fasciclin domain-containing protein, partial [Candidatus Thermoplasmatota archaeon]|nr:fasciclin domain-containing protein [Candidatus Thermoplasmatota archaeon]